MFNLLNKLSMSKNNLILMTKRDVIRFAFKLFLMGMMIGAYVAYNQYI